MFLRRGILILSILGLVAGCWYDPPTTHHRIESAARKPNEYTSAVIVYSEVSRPPRGLATFPNGGIAEFVSSEFSLSLLSPLNGGVRELHVQHVPREVQNAFSAGFIGWENESIYFQLSGCPGVECWGKHVRYLLYQANESGEFAQVTRIPESAKFKGQSLAPMPGERNYLRLGHSSDEIHILTNVEDTPQVVYTLNRETGTVEVAGK